MNRRPPVGDGGHLRALRRTRLETPAVSDDDDATRP